MPWPAALQTHISQRIVGLLDEIRGSRARVNEVRGGKVGTVGQHNSYMGNVVDFSLPISGAIVQEI